MPNQSIKIELPNCESRDDYYTDLCPPFTQVRATEVGNHVHLTVWVNHALAGSLTVRIEELEPVLSVLKGEEVDECPTDQSSSS